MANPLLSAGDPAPDFSLPAADDRDISLADLSGKYVILYFYPKDDTPGCTKEACDFRDALEALSSANTVVLGVSADTLASHEKFKAKYDLNFDLLSDRDKAVMNAYGVFREKSMYGKTVMGVVRSTFLIGPDGTLLEVWDKVTVHRQKTDGTVTRHIDAVRAALEAHQGA